jgi:nucleoside 2-deoxyribosyltransferase
MVADFTEHKPGVYFESGFAMGLGIEVIRTCRDTDLKDTHFDTRQYNHIVWKDELDLKDKLIARVQATVPLKHQPRAVSD